MAREPRGERAPTPRPHKNKTRQRKFSRGTTNHMTDSKREGGAVRAEWESKIHCAHAVVSDYHLSQNGKLTPRHVQTSVCKAEFVCQQH